MIKWIIKTVAGEIAYTYLKDKPILLGLVSETIRTISMPSDSGSASPGTGPQSDKTEKPSTN